MNSGKKTWNKIERKKEKREKNPKRK